MTKLSGRSTFALLLAFMARKMLKDTKDVYREIYHLARNGCKYTFSRLSLCCRTTDHFVVSRIWLFLQHANGLMTWNPLFPCGLHLDDGALVIRDL